MLCGSLQGRGVWGRMDTCICMAESLCCQPETITSLLISYTPIWNKKLKKNSSGEMSMSQDLSRKGREKSSLRLMPSAVLSPHPWNQKEVWRRQRWVTYVSYTNWNLPVPLSFPLFPQCSPLWNRVTWYHTQKTVEYGPDLKKTSGKNLIPFAPQKYVN